MNVWSVIWADVTLDYDSLAYGGNDYGEIDQIELDTYLDDMAVEGFVQCYENEWVMNIADLVVTDQLVSNDGTKLLKVRFYPMATNT